MTDMIHTPAIIIADVAIHQDGEGRYFLNDLHKASGGESRHKPSEWLRNQQTQELVNEIAKAGIPALASVKGGNAPGTFVVKELVYAYAMWISASFHLKVIRTFDAVVSGDMATAEAIAKPSRAKDPDPIILQRRRADAIISSTIRVGRLLGTEPAMARAIAVDEARRETGIDYQKLLANNSVAERPVTPTDLGKSQGWSGKQTNTHLETAGYQYKDSDGQWMPTEKGRPYCTVNPYKSPNSNHTGYRVLWFPRILEALLQEMGEVPLTSDNVVPMRGVLV
ncbi:putative DNA-binding protein [Gammaproteobacteria bacterium]